MPTIVVGIPTLNEAPTIERTTRRVDAGLARLGLPGVIVNCDSGSQDATVERFERTPTAHPKESLKPLAPCDGKGANLRGIAEYAAQAGADAVVFVDADVETLRPEWIPALAEPVLREGADYVCAAYQASQGGPLRHLLSRPVVYGLFGGDIAQPTGGEVALSGRLARRVATMPMKGSDYGYGIDILIACEAVAAGLPFCAVDLGLKVHRARRWSTIDTIAVQVAETALRVYRRASVRGARSVIRPLRQPASASAVTPPRSAIADADVLAKRWKSERTRFAALYARVLDPELVEFAQSETATGILNAPWHRMIRQFATACRTGTDSPQELAAALMPLFLGRMAAFADEIAGTDPLELTERLNTDLEDCLAAA
jgi:hypothetical protein